MYEISERVNTKLSKIKMSESFSEALAKANALTGSTNTRYSDTYSGTAVTKADISSVAQVKSASYSAVNLDYTGDFAGSKASTFTSRYDSIISSKSKQYGVNENVIKAIIQAESDFNPNTVSSAGAKGLMQLMPCNVEDLGIKNVFDPEENIDGGIREFKSYLTAYNGDIKIALAAYNCGPTRVRNLGITNLDDPEQFAKLPKETRNYINKIMKNLQ